MKYFVILVLMAISFFSNAQTTIKMEKDAGIYKVGCKVNGAPMKMYFDTGATVVSISRATAIYLYNNDLISKDDFVGKINTTTAEGAIVDNMLIRLKDVEIGGLHLKDVEAVVSSSLNAPLLLGQSVISRLGKISLDGDLLTIHSLNTESLSNEQRNELDNKLKMLSSTKNDKELDYKMLNIIQKIENSYELNEFELNCKLTAEFSLEQYEAAIIDAGKWIEIYSNDTNNIQMKMSTFWISACSNILSNKGNKDIGWQHLNRCRDYYKNDSTAHFYWFNIPNLTLIYALSKGDNFINSIYTSKLSICHFLKFEKVSFKEINNNKCLNIAPGVMCGFSCLESSYHHEFLRISNNSQLNQNQIKILELLTIICAKLGNEASIALCKQMGVNYRRNLNKKEIELIGLDCAL